MHRVSHGCICYAAWVCFVIRMLCVFLLCCLLWCIAKLHNKAFKQWATIALYLTNCIYRLYGSLYSIKLRFILKTSFEVIFLFNMLYTASWFVLCIVLGAS